MTQSLLREYFEASVPQIESEMRRVIAQLRGAQDCRPAVFVTMLNYHLGFAGVDGSPTQANTGKRIRPMLTLLCCEATGGNRAQALPAAAAIELLHNFSLIHDDIEDRDELRRGRPTLWKIWGEAKAINAGDAMFALAHIALENALEQGIEAERVLRALRVFDQTCLALTIGQHMDIEFEHRADVTAADYLAMIEGKTAALTRAACEIGAIMAGAPTDQIVHLAEFGRWLGVAFQLQDDVLGIWGNPALTGKQDSDLAHGKKTLPVLHAADQDQLVRERYLRRRPTDPVELAEVRALIEARGGRAYAEQAARDAHDKSLAELAAARVDNQAGELLRALAESLLGRQM
ncbi:MAG: polyprenyl synthetase family protein [Anaerolineae bacterium]|nr:polyprenyl synthetase family protein [Thermoflexales bacterium]MDW8407424.1 polyprenyl synthetase family protein [Anaerolineae bacterium]